MLWFYLPCEALVPAGRALLTIDSKRVLVGDEVLFMGDTGPEAAAVYEALVQLLATATHGVVRCRLRRGAGRTEAVAWLHGAESSTAVVVPVVVPAAGAGE